MKLRTRLFATEQMDNARSEALVDQFRRMFGARRAEAEGFPIAPLFVLPDPYGVGSRVRVWLNGGMRRMGDLRLADVWLDGEKP